ncbi:MAG: hypothetical protein K0Q76_1996 [Panacagrimonas sp.]|jgi:hypothetical protein|nr:hypothetical protein [Panacagrimonas sp.]MCC2656888.1 hypothetical protein [Panacagrimonas sp.]
MAPDEAITEYWRQHYCAGDCTICGGRGWFDTTGTCSRAGRPVGRLHYCICPNGQQLRASNFPITSDGAGHPAH